MKIYRIFLEEMFAPEGNPNHIGALVRFEFVLMPMPKMPPIAFERLYAKLERLGFLRIPGAPSLAAMKKFSAIVLRFFAYEGCSCANCSTTTSEEEKPATPKPTVAGPKPKKRGKENITPKKK